MKSVKDLSLELYKYNDLKSQGRTVLQAVESYMSGALISQIIQVIKAGIPHQVNFILLGREFITSVQSSFNEGTLSTDLTLTTELVEGSGVKHIHSQTFAPAQVIKGRDMDKDFLDTYFASVLTQAKEAVVTDKGTFPIRWT